MAPAIRLLDTDVPYEQSMLMYEKLIGLGVDARLITLEGADHVFDQHFQEPAVQDAFKQVIAIIKDRTE